MKYIHFIVNPISGNGKHSLSATYLRTFFPRSEFRIEVEYTKHKKHAIELAADAVKEAPYCIVACGGDGTINEVASSLVGTPIKLGIIPVGSGNGLASNLKVPKDIESAVAIIKNGNLFSIDVGTVNGQYFFSNMGIGIDAQIIKKYERSRKRTLISYIKATISASLSYKTWETKTSIEGKITKLNPLLLFISNSNEMGYNMSLTPKASLNDGLLDLLVVPQLNFFEKLILGYYVLRNKVENFKKSDRLLINNISVEIPDKIFIDIQIDGEHHNLKTNKMNISLIKGGLSVLVD